MNKQEERTAAGGEDSMADMLELRNISKLYGRNYANKNISLTVKSGEVHCLLGENGAGKSTLMNVLYGLTKPDSGEIFIDGSEVSILSPRDAIRYGIGMVHQHFMLIPAMTVVDNIILSTDESSGVILNQKKIAKRIREIAGKYGFEVDPFMKVSDLSVGQQQRVEIIKAIYHDCRLLILDEPTAVLTPRETEELYAIIERFRKENKSVIFISHKLHEVMHVSDVISVLRNGECIATLNKEETDEASLAACMVGKEVSFTVEKEKAHPGEAVLEVSGLSTKGKKGNLAVDDLSLTVHSGEIYGVAGVDGNGQAELIETITGLVKSESGKVRILGHDMTNRTPGEILDQGISHIPADRQSTGILMHESLEKNLTLYDYRNPEYRKGIFMDWRKAKKQAEDMVEKYGVKTPGLSLNIEYLSGGNQQKAVVARELEKKPELLIAAHPTRGVDIGAIEFIHGEIVKARDQGCAVLLISTELDEIMALSDRIGVIYDGRIIGEMDREEATVEKIGMLMAGMEENERKAV